MPVPLFDDLLRPFEFTISRILVTAHDVFAAAGLPAAGGVTWMAAIAALVVVVRCALLPLVVRQARMSQRLARA